MLRELDINEMEMVSGGSVNGEYIPGLPSSVQPDIAGPVAAAAYVAGGAIMGALGASTGYAVGNYGESQRNNGYAVPGSVVLGGAATGAIAGPSPLTLLGSFVGGFIAGASDQRNGKSVEVVIVDVDTSSG